MGLRTLYNERFEGTKGFTFESAKRFFNVASDVPGQDLVPDLHTHYMYCQMTNLKDLENPKAYSHL